MTAEEPAVDAFGVTRLSKIPEETGPAWLIEGLWTRRGVGFVGGPPKVGKSWLALEIALAVGSGAACMGWFPVHERGPVLVYCVEDGRSRVRTRMHGLCAARRVDFDRLPVGWLDVDRLALDRPGDQLRLEATVRKTKARMLILDPLVRLHRGDETSSRDMSLLLSFLRGLQQEHGVAVLLVHHTRKAPVQDPGQGLRGSGDLHAWGDSNLYYTKGADHHVLTIEHRSEPAHEPLHVDLLGSPPHLAIGGRAHQSDSERVLSLLSACPLNRTDLRDRLAIRNERLGEVLQQLEANGKIRRANGRVALAE